ncbi:cyclic peptide export ABC transporter [Nitrospira defluvii]|nr:cyclic peptide export ABC transporter [Nitrospira defluvii]
MAAMITGVFSGAFSTALIALINKVGNNPMEGHFILPLTLFVGLLIARLVFGVISKVMLNRLTQGIIYELHLMLSRRILLSPLRLIEKIGIPKIMAALSDDIRTISEAFRSIPILCIDITIFLACMIYIGYLSIQLLIMTVIFCVVGIASYHILAKQGVRYFSLARKKENTLFEHFRGMTEGFKELKLNARRTDEFLNRHLEHTVCEYKGINIKALNIFAVAEGWGELLFFIPIGVALFLMPVLIEIPQNILWGYVLTVIFLIRPLGDMVNMFPNLGRANVAANNIKSLELSLVDEGVRNTHLEKREKIDSNGLKQLELVGVTHTYHDDKKGNGFTLGPIDLSFYPKEIVFVTGGNGSGKSTLAKLITGLYSPQSGEIIINGKRVLEVDNTWYRQHFSAIFADFHLFKVLMGINNDKIENEARTYLNWLELENKISINKGRFSTTALSHGQRKRLALLIALLEDRPIYVFDEWAADQDPQFREIYYTEILKVLKQRGKTVVVITHDDRYFYLADRIIKLDYGKIEYNQGYKGSTRNKGQILTS